MNLYYQPGKVFAFSYLILLSSFSNSGAQQLCWAEYVGGLKQENAEEIDVDHHGNIIMSGTSSSTGMATPGAYQYYKSTGNDFFLSKYRSNGTLVWTTYYGGTGDDYLFSMTIDASDNIYLGGQTKSAGLASQGAYQTSVAGNYDALLVKFDSSGNRQWATYFGGINLDQLLFCTTDGQQNVFISGFTQSTTNIATANGMQPTFGGGKGDGFLTKFNSSGTMQWSTFFGGTASDRFHGLTIDHDGNIIAIGTTQSAHNIATTGAFQTTPGGGNDAFISKWTNSGALLWATYYGKEGHDRGRECCVDEFNNIYVTGFTSSDSMMATSGAYKYYWSQGYEANGTTRTNDVYLAKFSATGSRIWSTYYGGTASEWPRGIARHDGLIVLTGLTSSASGIASADALQPQIAGGLDVYLAVFNDSGSFVWSTYYGGTKDESMGGGYGADIDFDSEGNLLLSFTTYSNDLPSTNTYHGSTRADGMVACITTNFFPRVQQNHSAIKNPNFYLYPNPASGQCTIAISAQESYEAQIIVSDLAGNILVRKRIYLVEGKNLLTQNLSSLRDGSYLAEIIFDNGEIMMLPFVKQQ